jgi:DNA-binding transcriptional LysR family regulator
MLDVETLQIYCDLIEMRSFSKAAAKHIISQSAISQQLSKLELAHKCQLLDRQKRPFEPTAAGQLLYDTCKDMLSRYEQFKNDLTERQRCQGDRINIAAIFSIGMHSLPPYLKKFLSRYPTVNLNLEYCSWDQVHEKVLQGSAEIGLVAVPKRDKNLDIYEFESEPLVIVCSKESALASDSADFDLKSLADHKFIAFAKHVPTRQLIDGLLVHQNITLRPAMEFDNIETIKRAVEINSGISILPRTAIIQELSAGTLQAISIDDPKFVRPTGIIVRKNRAMSPPARYLLELLQNRWV